MMIAGEQITVRHSVLGWRRYWPKYRHGVYALENLNCQFNRGVNVILGPNGSGKTTLLQVLAGLVIPQDGTVMTNGQVCDRSVLRGCVSYLPQNFGLYPQFTAQEHLYYVALLKGITDRRRREEAVAVVLQQTGLVAMAQQRVGTYSRGMRQKVGIAQALLGDAAVLLLDEPTAGLDPEERNKLHALMVQIGQQRSVILASSLLADVHCADIVLVLTQGQRCFMGTPAELAACANEERDVLVCDELIVGKSRNALERGYRAVLRKRVKK
ncbi:ABC-type multidrug transport system ATPase subunit [Sporomusaceae bacterium BoRhaA]|uniref:ATP-binding cassette domain-containing protein n=1 Tax=Pelorhabdus rhamnosifermentans TaxID=2772457 RepID=UPI001C06323B|nr:ATP-binding cassette domain-containing protein [Pelorhabdus rhamnosifermentans]MBU2699555.1 ABC-type multidrug transport system ATPase subunit [Pelorhabdus rhamnosifermentans]